MITLDDEMNKHGCFRVCVCERNTHKGFQKFSLNPAVVQAASRRDK